MISIFAENVNHAFYDVWWRLKAEGVLEESRNGPVMVFPSPVVTTYRRPEQRVLFHPLRDANCVFHLVEAIWMLAGRNDVSTLLPFNKQYINYAEPDGRVHGAYGSRWRRWEAGDQILKIVDILTRDPNSRQAVMQMWDGFHDLGAKVKDKPCNTHIYFDCRKGHLNMTVCCRSNDILWGAYGANVVHFSVLQEVIATAIGVPLGEYRQFSNNFHVYTDNAQVKHFLDTPPFDPHDEYQDVHRAKAYPILQKGEPVRELLDGCESFCDHITQGHGGLLNNAFLNEVAWPLSVAYLERQRGNGDWRQAMRVVPKDCDWKINFDEWTTRREHERA